MRDNTGGSSVGQAVDSLDGNLVSLYVMLCEYVKEAVTSGVIAVLEQHKFIVLLKGMRDILSKLNLLNVSMQTQSLPFSTLKVLVNATREGLKREWIDLSAPSHPMLVSGACVTGGDSFKKLVEQMKSGGLDQDDSDDKTFKRHRMGDSLLACLMMIHSNGPSLHEKEEVEKFLLAVVARFKAFKRRVPSKGCGRHPQPPTRSVRLRPRPNPLFCLSFRVCRMFYSMISSTMSSTQKTCQSRGPLPLCQILFQ